MTDRSRSLHRRTRGAGAMFRHEFRRTPLSAAVPLEGSDTVVGLRELEQAQRREALQSLFGAPTGAHCPALQEAAHGCQALAPDVADVRHRCLMSVYFSGAV